MKIVLAFDSFKGCMTAEEACHTAALAIHEVLPQAEVVECPLSDGGEGLVDCVDHRCKLCNLERRQDGIYGNGGYKRFDARATEQA